MSLGLILAIAALAGVIVKGFTVFWRRKRSGAENNWSNENYLLHRQVGSWSEIDGGETAPPFYGSGGNGGQL